MGLCITNISIRLQPLCEALWRPGQTFMLSLNRLGLRSPSLSASCLWLMDTICDHHIAIYPMSNVKNNTVLCLLFMSNLSTMSTVAYTPYATRRSQYSYGKLSSLSQFIDISICRIHRSMQLSKLLQPTQ